MSRFRWKTCLVLLSAGIELLAGTENASAWGDRTHPAVNRLAIESLPQEAAAYFRPHAEALARKSVEPDTVMRGREGRAEEVRHFMDLDAHMFPPFRDFPRYYRDAVRRFGKRELEENGLLPWVILRFQRQLEEAIRADDAPRMVREAAYLGHYVADAFQPLHLTKNHDGRSRAARGVHKRFENCVADDRIDEHVAAIRRLLRNARVVQDLRDEIFDAVFRSYPEAAVVLRADEEARRRAAVDSPAYCAMMHDALDVLVEKQLADATSLLGSLWLTAWEKGRGAR